MREEHSMSKITPIFTQDIIKDREKIGEAELGIDEDYKLYWNKKEILTKQKITLQWWVNLSIIVAAASTLALAVLALLQLLGCGAKT